MSKNKLTLTTLESWLWDSANILRGSIDSSDFKNYIFGLLFLKRSNDVFEEEVEAIMKRDNVSREEAEDDTYFQLPEEYRWETIKKYTENIGIALDKAFAGIERENTSLEGVMTATKFGDKEKLSDELLQRLLRHFNQHSLRNDNLESNDLLGDAYEYLIKMFADDAGKKGGEFYTPRGVVELIVKLIKPEPKHKIYDPTCGSGGMLIESARYIAEQPNGKVGNNVNVSLYGQEKNLGTWAIGKLNMLLHNFMDADIRKGDTLTSPQHRNDNNELTLFDRVIANPPFSMDGWWTPAENSIEVKLDKNGKEKKVKPNYNKVVSDPFGRFQFGIPPRGYADLAFLQHMVAVLKHDGKAGVVLPHGTLFRSGTEGKIRKALIEADLVEGIVGLPSALFYNTGIPASIWIINKNKTEAQKGKVSIIDASNDYKDGKNQNELLEEHIAKIVDAYDEAKDVEKYMRIVEIAEIAENDYNLNISRFIDTSEPEPIVDIKAVHEKLAVLEEKEANIDEKLAGFFKGVGIMMEGYKKSVFGLIPENWDVVPVNEITKEHKQGYYTKESYVDEGIRLARITDLNNPKIDYSEMPKLNISEADFQGYKIEKGDFLFARSGAIGTYGIVEKEEFPAIFASYLIRFRFNSNIVNRYFGYFFESYLCSKQLKGITQGNANVNINAGNIKSLKFPFAPLSEQQKIAEILSTVDAKIEIIDQQITETQELKKGLMQRLLTKGIGHTEFKDSALGEIPKSWEVVSVREICKLKGGFAFKSSDSCGDGIRWVKIANVGVNKIKWDDESFLPLGFEIQHQDFVLNEGDIILAMTRPILNGRLKIARVNKSDSGSLLNQRVGRIIENQNLNKDFAYQVFNSTSFINLMEKELLGTDPPNISSSMFEALSVALPTKEEQQKIADILSSVDEKLDVLLEKKTTYQELKKGLMQQLLTGKVRVKV